MVRQPIAAGDEVIMYANYKQCYVIKVTMGQYFQSRFGSVKHDNLIGRFHGTKVQCSKGYVYVLKPTPELYTAVVRHRTQILYPHDVSLILCQLEAKPGTVLLEAGTGSGAFTRAAARLLAPNGKIHTFEINEDRYKLAAEDFKDSSVIKVYKRNVCLDGFDPLVTGETDAIFLDLSAPWDVIPFCLSAFKKDKICRFGSFSPCIEQVQKTCNKLRDCGFAEVSTVECVPREYKVVDLSAPLQDFGGKGVAVVPTSAAKRRRVDEQKNLETTNNDTANNLKEIDEKKDDNVSSGDCLTKPRDDVKTISVANNDCYLSYVSDPIEQPTHTGYLTFATLLPRIFVQNK